MRTLSISLDDELYERLKHNVSSKKVSSFVAFAIKQELQKKEQELKDAYQSAQVNSLRNIELAEWDQCRLIIIYAK